MSDTMLFGVLRMPYELAMSSELSRRQYWDRAQQALDEIDRLRKAISHVNRKCDHLGIRLGEVIRERDALHARLHNAESELTRLRTFRESVWNSVERVAGRYLREAAEREIGREELEGR